MISYASLKIQGFQNIFDTQPRFTSLKNCFQKEDSMYFIQNSQNSNIKSFYILLLNYIQIQHYKRLLFELKAQQESIQSGIRRERKVSFNGKSKGVFAETSHKQIFPLNMLKTYIFSQSSQFQLIQNSPLKKQSQSKIDQPKKKTLSKYQPYLKRQFSNDVLKLKEDNKMTKSNNKSLHLQNFEIKKFLAEFLKLLLPQSINKSYKNEIKSTSYLMQIYPIICVALNIVMRYVLLTKYKVAQAKFYDKFINDKVVMQYLCEAFYLDGLEQNQRGYQIKKQFKIYIIKNNQLQICNKNIEVIHNVKKSEIRQTQASQNKERQDSKSKDQQNLYVVTMPKQFFSHQNKPFFNLNLKKRVQIKKQKDKKIKEKDKNKLAYFEPQQLSKFNNFNQTNIQTKSANNFNNQNQISKIINNINITQLSNQNKVIKRPSFLNFRKSLKHIQQKKGSQKQSQPNSPSSPKKFFVDQKIKQQMSLTHSYHSNLDKSDFQISNNQILEDIQKVLNLDFQM